MPLILTPFRFANFRLWAGANLVSVTGSWMQILAANWLLLTATGSAAQMGFGVLLHALPALMLGPWAGAIADLVAARPLLTVTQTLHALLSVMLAVVAVSDVGAVTPWVYGASLFAGLIGSVEGPALGRFGSTMVDREHLGAALAVGSVSGSAGRIVGMSIGGILIASAGAGPVFLINAATFLVVILALIRLRPLPPEMVEATPTEEEDSAASDEPVPSSALAGLRYLLRDPMVAITLGLALLLGSLSRNYQVTMAAMSAGPLEGGADGYGMLSTIFAIGAVVGGLCSARAGKMYGRHLVAVGLAMSVLQGISGLAPGMWSFAALLLPIAAAAVVVDTVVATRLQLDKPLAIRGRVLAAVGTTGAIAGAVGAPMLGWLSDGLGPRAALVAAGLVTTLGCVAAGFGYGSVARRNAAKAQQPARLTHPRPLGTLPVPTPAANATVPQQARRAAPEAITPVGRLPLPEPRGEAPAPRREPLPVLQPA